MLNLVTQDVFHCSCFYLGNRSQIVSSFQLSKRLDLLCRRIQTVKLGAKYQQTTCTATTIQPQTKFSYIGRRWSAYCHQHSVLACSTDHQSLSFRDQVIHPKCRRFLHAAECPVISRRNHRFSTTPEKRQEWRRNWKATWFGLSFLLSQTAGLGPAAAAFLVKCKAHERGSSDTQF